MTLLAGLIDPNPQGEVGLLFYNSNTVKQVWKTEDLIGYLLVLPCSMIEVNGKMLTKFRQDS